MTSKELEQKLNKLSDKIKFSVREYDKDGTTLSADSDRLTLLGVSKGEIWIYVVRGDQSNIYMGVIKLAHQFMADKEKGNE